MRKFIAQNIVLILQDIVKGTSIRSTYKFLKKSQYYSDNELYELQLKKLKKLIVHSYNNVPYYTNLFNSINLKPEDIKSLEDINKIPITNKQMARDAGKDIFGSNKKNRKIKIGKTGGTTGIPLFFKKDTQARSFSRGAYFRWYNWMGIKRSDRVVTLWGAPLNKKTAPLKKIKNNLAAFLTNDYTIDSFNINEKTLPHIVRTIKEKQPDLLKGYLSALLQIAHYLDENDIDSIRPKAVSSTTETLLPPYRFFLQKVFNCPIYDQYGCGEIGAIAFECEMHEGLHITSEHCLVEVVNNENENIYSEVGDIIITDLDNYEMPFIRYKNGDSARLLENKCSCGKNLPLLAEIAGRIADTIVLKNGSKVHGVFFTNILGELNFIENKYIKRFQVYQSENGSIDFRIESDKELEYKNEVILLNVLKKYFHKANITYHKRISEDKSGKFRYVKSEIKDDSEIR